MKTQSRTLKVDLNSRQSAVEERKTTELSLEEKVGGFGNAVRVHERNLAAHPDLLDAYDPRNIVCFDIGFATGSNLMTSRRTYVSAISPLKTSKKGTNSVMYSAASGDLGVAIRRAGLDSIQIAGKSENPVYLVIDGDQATLVDAAELVGKTTHDKIMALASLYDDAAFAVVGPAAENKVRYASIAFSTYDQVKKGSRNMRFAGRGGMGAVLADKNVLGIVVKGDPDNRLNLGDLKELNREVGTGKKTDKYRKVGTYGANMEATNLIQAAIINNFSQTSKDEMKKVYRRELEASNYTIDDKGCVGCAVKCWKVVSKDGRVLGKVDYEPGSLLGPNIGIFNIEQTLELIDLVDSLGIDSMSAGVCIGYEMDKQQRFGDFEFAKELLNQIANGEHPLKEGVFRYAGNAPNAMHIKGIELAAYLGNLNPGYAFAIGGGHMTMDTYSSWCYKDKTMEAANSVDEWVENIIRGPQIILYDMNGICKFAKVDFDHVAQLYETLYGEKITASDLRDLAKLVNFRVRKMDERVGFGAEDEVLPANCHLDLGFSIQHFNTPDFFGKVKEGVYQRLDQMEAEYKEKEIL